MSDVSFSVASVHVHPVKSCAGISPAEALVTETGFDLDRVWMVVDTEGRFVSQRELPRMALVRTELKHGDLVLRAPGMLALHVSPDRVEQRARVSVWNDSVEAWDMGALCAQWFTDFLGRPLRLARFDPEQRRIASREWTGAVEAETAFQDGFPLLVASLASLGEVNRRLVEAGAAPVTMARFRPNIVLDGLEAHDEDHLDEIALAGPDGTVRLKLVKPCPRCPIPDVDPATGIAGHAVGDTLQQYRADARVGGAVTFGMNAIVLEGGGRRVAAGRAGSGRYAFG